MHQGLKFGSLWAMLGMIDGIKYRDATYLGEYPNDDMPILIILPGSTWLNKMINEYVMGVIL